MNRPSPEPIDPSRLVEVAQAVMKAARFPSLATLDGNHDQVRIEGVAEEVVDRGLLQGIWDANPLLRNYLGSIDNPDLIFYKVVPGRVRFISEWALEYHEVPLR